MGAPVAVGAQILALDWVVVVFVVVFVLLAISLFGGFSMALPQSWLNKLNSVYDSDGATAGVCNNGCVPAFLAAIWTLLSTWTSCLTDPALPEFHR